VSSWKRSPRRRRSRSAAPKAKASRYPRRVKGTGIAPIDLLALARAVRRCTGWISKKYAGKAKPSWELIYDMHQDVDAYKAFQADYPGFRVLPDDERIAQEILTWCVDEDDEDYRQSLHRAVSRDDVAGADFALVCSAVDAYARAMEDRYISEYFIGTVGERGALRLTLKRIRAFKNKYGTAYRLVFLDDRGAEAVWFASNSPAKHGLAIDRTYEIRATIRDHVEFRGSKQTRITRGSVLSGCALEPAASAA
jgi:hypothetical protein